MTARSVFGLTDEVEQSARYRAFDEHVYTPEVKGLDGITSTLECGNSTILKQRALNARIEDSFSAFAVSSAGRKGQNALELGRSGHHAWIVQIRDTTAQLES